MPKHLKGDNYLVLDRTSYKNMHFFSTVRDVINYMFSTPRYAVALIYTLSMALIPLTFILREQQVPVSVLEINNQRYGIRNSDYNNPILQETVSDNYLLIAIVFGSFVYTVILWFGAYVEFYKWADALNYIVSYAMAFVTQAFIVEYGKNYLGSFRPNFYEGCEWDDALSDCTREFDKGRRAFPSAHAASSSCVYTSTVLILFVLRKHIIEANAPRVVSDILMIISVLCVFTFMFIGVTRVHDYWHHPVNVVAGFAVGCGCAYGFFILV